MTIHYRDTSTNSTKVEVPLGLGLAQHLANPRDHSAKPQFYRTVGKRVLDVTLCILGAPFALLMIGVAALLVARDGGQPFYSQDRVGLNGRIYRIWKLRSMVPDADAKLEAHLSENADARAEWDKDQKLKSDPRITRLGVLLRRTSLDELPQLWNVFKGDMSLVGPRPMMPEQEILYPGHEYYGLRPGITGSWQVSERNETSFAERAVFDTSYSRNMSLTQDIRILCATVKVVVKATGY